MRCAISYRLWAILVGLPVLFAACRVDTERLNGCFEVPTPVGQRTGPIVTQVEQLVAQQRP
jgi:hypothetical protein